MSRINHTARICPNCGESVIAQRSIPCQVVSDRPSNESTGDFGIRLSLDAILRHYADILHIDPAFDNVKLYKFVAAKLSKISKRRWSWRYVLSVRNGTIQPGGLMINAVAQLHEQILLPPPSPRPPRIAALKGDAKKAVESLFGDYGLDQDVRDEFIRLVAAKETEIEY